MEFGEHALYIENLRSFLEYDEEIKDGDEPLPKTGDIVFKNVSFKYDGAENYTLKNLNLTFGRNEKIAIVGHNGAGKSTIVKLLLRLYDAEGEILYGDKNIKSFKLDEYRQLFSAVMQDFHIFALTVEENVKLGRVKEGDAERIKHAILKSGMAEKIDSFENKEKTILTREFDSKGEQLSGGEQQKLAIAHVYSKDNRFVVLDEPSSALDPIAEHKMYKNMMDACENCGMIFISHRLSSAIDADRIYLIEDGSVAEVGTHGELMEQNGKYAEMFRRQAENYSEVTP